MAADRDQHEIIFFRQKIINQNVKYYYCNQVKSLQKRNRLKYKTMEQLLLLQSAEELKNELEHVKIIRKHIHPICLIVFENYTRKLTRLNDWRVSRTLVFMYFYVFSLF